MQASSQEFPENRTEKHKLIVGSKCFSNESIKMFLTFASSAILLLCRMLNEMLFCSSHTHTKYIILWNVI